MEDLRSVLEIAGEHKIISQWSLQDYENEVRRKDSNCFVAVSNLEIVGFLIVRLITSSGEAEILNIAVKNDFEGKGVGKQLLKRVLEQLEQKEIETIWLEVRKSNQRAQKFYERFGFKMCGRRSNYYKNPTEDALLMKFERQ